MRKNIQNNALILHNIKKYQTFIPNPSPQTFKILNIPKSYIYKSIIFPPINLKKNKIFGNLNNIIST